MKENLKAGDKVRVSYDGSHYRGKVGTVESVRKDSCEYFDCQIKFDSSKGRTYGFDFDEIELA